LKEFGCIDHGSVNRYQRNRLTSIAITGSSGKTLKDYWNAGVEICLGLFVANGPTCVQLQDD
jgi:hypothetical protein